METINIENLGFTQSLMEEAAQYEDFYAGRVSSQYKDMYKVITKQGEVYAEISGKFRHETEKTTDYPAVGDFVMLDRVNNDSGNAIIHYVLTRKSKFERKAAGKANNAQLVATNINTVFICMSLNNDFNLRRTERYLSIIWDSGATPVVVLTKSDLCTNLEEKVASVQDVAIGVDILTTSYINDEYANIKSYISFGKTIAFVGSSGVGKSSLINKLLNSDTITTSHIRNDDKGRHTTTRRELFILPNETGCVIDTPGMRELGVESIDLTKTFLDIDEMSKNCKFKDCKHEKEPSCAVIQAIQDGILTEERLNNYKKLKREAKYEGLNSREIEAEKTKEMFAEFGGVKNARNFIKNKNKKGV